MPSKRKSLRHGLALGILASLVIVLVPASPARAHDGEPPFDLDARLRALWEPHPRFTLIPHATSFFRKMTTGLAILEHLVAQASEERT